MPMNRTLVTSLKGTHFTEELITNAREDESIVIAVSSVKKRVDCDIIQLSVIALENLAYHIYGYYKDTFANATDVDADSFAFEYEFKEADGQQITGAGPYYYQSANFKFPYEDQDNSGELHLTVVNRSVATKTADADGEMAVGAVLAWDPE